MEHRTKLTGTRLVEIFEAAADGAESVEAGDGWAMTFAETLRSCAEMAARHRGKGVSIDLNCSVKPAPSRRRKPSVAHPDPVKR